MNSILLSTPSSWGTLADILRWRALYESEKQAYTFLLDGETHEAQWSYAQLDANARRIAALLQQHTTPGERVLLLYQPGLEYIAAVFGCFYAGVVAVPAYPPRLNHNLTRIETILQDAQATVSLTTSTILTSLRRKFALDPSMQHLHWLETDIVSEDVAQSWQEYHAKNEDLALLQYTSGSTGIPKGVMLTHDNLLQNARLIQESMRLNAEMRVGSWLPPYHDMGLMGGILEALYVGAPAILMAPPAFLQQPLRWLRMISRYSIGASCAPNFAYDLCIKKATPEQLTGLDLSCWQVALTGAEPVRAETLERFAETFAPYGFRQEAFNPSYGLAEATLFVSGGQSWAAPRVLALDGKAIEAGRVVAAIVGQEQSRSFVGCGHAREGQQIIIVDPQRQTKCALDEVGEIWVASPNMAQGYWGKAQETQETFHARVEGSGEGPFLRTGDLGFLSHGELFITGRLKDVIIIRGRNLYPQDIELLVEKSHPALRQSCCAAFAVPGDGTERLVVVQEVERHYEKWDIQDIIWSIRQAVVSAFEVDVAAVELLRAGTIYKTSSGKIQRSACRQGFLTDELQSVYHWDQEGEAAHKSTNAHVEAEEAASDVLEAQTEHLEINKKVSEIVAWLVTRIAEQAHIDPGVVDPQAPFVHYGLNSLEAVGLSGELEQWLGRSFSPTLVYDYPSIDALAHYLAHGEQPVEVAIDVTSHHAPKKDAIAIIGMACHFPGANTPDDFWQFLRSGGDGISEVPKERWNTQAWYDPQSGTPGKMSTRWGGFLQGIDQFDPGFFNISPREAIYIDPQQRLLLEVAWEAFEQAGIVPAKLAGSQTGVFVGVSSSDYYALHHADPNYHQAYTGTGNAHSIAANRLSYFFDFHGPSVAVDTACSSSLFAVHQACQSLRSGECSLALAGGVNVILTPELSVTFSQAHMMAADGHCKTFDASADGYVRGEGCGVVLLKPLEDAQRDGDPILGIIRGSAVNQDGASNGLTAPNGRAQEAVIRQALSNAGVRPEQIGYVETHGTGTSLGDPIEVNALKAVLMQQRTPEQSCVLGAVKTNVGHLEAAAGIASLIKVVLSLQHGTIPPNLHFSTLNPYIEHDVPLFIFPTEEQAWPSLATHHFAGVSAFGFGGTNVHVVLEAALVRPKPTEASDSGKNPYHLLTLSARSDTAVQHLAQQYRQWLEGHPEIALADLCFMANTGRTHFPHRLALLANSTQQLQELLSGIAVGDHTPATRERGGIAGTHRKIVFLFTGQGAQYIGMARQLYETQPIFRRELNLCAQLLQPYLDQSLLSVLYPTHDDISPLNETAYAQPVLFALEYALVVLWRSWGVEPDLVLGHSVGEYVAACVAGMMSLEEGLKLIALRGRLMQDLPLHGAMLAVFASREQIEPFLAPHQSQVAVAVINGPEHVVLSGADAVLHALERQLGDSGIDSRPLKVSHAFHSPLLEPMLDAFTQAAQEVSWQPAIVPLVCNLNGQILSIGATLDAAYWRRQTRETVQFAASMQTAYEQDGHIFIEMGPQDILTRLGRRCIPDQDLCWLPSLKQGTDDVQTLFSSVMTFYELGGDVNWSGFDQPFVHSHLSLPTYPFEHNRYWFTSSKTGTTVAPLSVLPVQSNGTRRIAFQNGLDNVMQTEDVRVVSTPPSQREGGYLPRRERFLSQLRGLLGSLLHMDQNDIAANTHFLELGADSIVLIDAVRQIEQTFSLKIPIRQLFDELSTLDALATHLDQVLPPDASLQKTIPTPELPDHVREANLTPAPLSPLEQPVSGVERVATLVELQRSTSTLTTTEIERVFTRQLDVLSDILSQQLDVLRMQTGGMPHERNQSSLSSSNGRATTNPNDFQPSQVAYVPFQPIRPQGAETLDVLQQRHLDELSARLIQRTQASRSYAQQYRPVLADNRASAGFRFSIKEILYPIVADKSQGAYFWDIDGNRYLDITMGFGVNLFGHNVPFIQEALSQQLKTGIQLGPQSRLAGDVATLIHELTGMERVTFCNSGTEAVMTAVRLARAATGKSKIVLFSGSYHGTFDGVLARSQAQNEHASLPLAPGVPEKMADDVLVVPYGSAHSLNIIQAHAHELAAVLVEPVQSRHPDVQPWEFLHQLRRLTRETGVALIFDETITGFRIHPGGAQAWFDVQADLATYGKIVGGGMPIGVIAGAARYLDGIDGGMWQYGDRSYPQADTTFFAGTFCKHPLAMSAAHATLSHLKSQGAVLQEQLNAKTAQLVETLNAFFKEENVSIACSHFGSLFRFTFTQNMDLFFYHLLDKGIYIWEGRNCFLSTAHTDEDIATLVRSIKETIWELRAGGFFPTPPTASTSKKSGEVSRQQDATSDFLVLALPAEIIELRKQEISTGIVTRSFPLTPAQQNFWTASQVDKKGGFNAYVETVVLQLAGEFSLSGMQYAYNAVVARHEALRTIMSPQGDMQHVLPESQLTVYYQDISSFPVDIGQRLVTRWLDEESYRDLDLTQGPLVRLSVLKLEEQRHLLLFAVHHSVADGWSMAVVLQEIAQLYTAHVQKRSYQLPLPLQFREYVYWQEQQMRQGGLLADERFWSARLAEPFPTLALPIDHPHLSYKTFAGDRVSKVLDANVQHALRRLASQQGCTLYMVLLAAYLLWLHRITNQEEVVVGVPTAGRLCAGSETLVGHAMNLLPLRNTLTGSPTFLEYLHAVKQNLLELYEHQDYPLAHLQRKLDPHGQSYAINTTFNLDPALALDGLGDLNVVALAAPVHYVKFDIGVFVTAHAGQLDVDVHYNRDVFEAETILRLTNHLFTLLESICAHPDLPLWRQSLLTDGEVEQFVETWNRTRVEYPQNGGIHTLFEQQVQRSPHAVALLFEGEQWTYQRINQQANQLAQYLRRQGVGPETLVGLYMERGVVALISMLAILKAGGAYVPLSSDLPSARLTSILKDADISLLLTRESINKSLADYHGEVLCYEKLQGASGNESIENLNVPVRSENISYVVYTSGSTGQPKGVLSTHGGVVNYLHYLRTTYELTSDSVVLQLPPLSFDASVRDIFGPLSVGATVLLLQEEEAKDPDRVLAQIRRHKVSALLSIVPSFLRVVLERADEKGLKAPSLRLILTSGERLLYSDVLHARAVFGEQVSAVNQYGPTEMTMTSTYYQTDGVRALKGNVPIGRPIPNLQAYVLDRDLLPVPIGVSGELYLSGAGIARGYLRQPALTAERFLPHPFSTTSGTLLYRTGDLARYRADGVLEYLERLDHQVKVRGNRVELGEIETLLVQHPSVKHAIVLTREERIDDQPSTMQIIAYIIAEYAQELSHQQWRDILQEHLPDYMFPTAFVYLESFPLTPNGKLDRKALLALPVSTTAGKEVADSFVAARNPLEEALTAIWQQVLVQEPIGVRDNFFALGGHSLLATLLVLRVRDAIGIELSLRTLFDTPTIEAMAQQIVQLQGEQDELQKDRHETMQMDVSALVPPPRPALLPLSFAQERLWFLSQLDPESTAYSIPAVVHLDGLLYVDALNRSLQMVAQRHEILHTTIQIRHGQAIEVILPAVTYEIPVIDLRDLPDVGQEILVEQIARQEAGQVFDLGKGPLLRMYLIRLEEQKHMLLFTMHHIISDGWSLGILVRELSAYYQAETQGMPASLPELPIQYADYALWQREWLQGDVLQEQLCYWRQHLAGAPTLLNLPTDHPRPAMQSFVGAQQEIVLSAQLLQGLKKLSEREGVSLFMTLLAVYQVLLMRYSGQQDIVVGIPIANRTRRELENLIGMFVNTLALRTDLSGNLDFLSLLKRLREVALQAFAHQEVPFERLVDALAIERSLSYTPVFQTFFTLQTMSLAESALPELSFVQAPFVSHTVKFDLEMEVRETAEGLLTTVKYATELFEPATIERLLQHWQTLLSGIVQEPEQCIEDLPLLSVAEQTLVVETWNDTTRPELAALCLHQLVELQVQRAPEAIAVVFEESSLTYHELNIRANQLAYYLRKISAVGPDTLVGVYVERSLEMVIGILAILKAGGAFVPLDPSYPQERLSFMLEDARPAIVLTQKDLLPILPATQIRVLCLDDVWENVSSQSVSNPSFPLSPENLAYMIYTSGSTSKPKGTMNTHRGISNNTRWKQEHIAFSSDDRMLQRAPLSFDASVEEIFLPLVSGGQLVVARPEGHREIGYLTSLIQRQAITTLGIVPSMLQIMLDEPGFEQCQSLRTVLCGGEALSLALQQRFFTSFKHATLLNLYGPTEAAIQVSCYEGRRDDPRGPIVPIGYPIANTQMYILDGRLQPVPVGVVGEVYIAGVGLGRGYFLRPDLTAERFIPNPFAKHQGERLYRTGDLARYQLDGVIEYLGRLDFQVKLRGIRIELGEIEAVLRSHSHIQEAVVTLYEESTTRKYLVAYIVTPVDVPPTSHQLRAYLRDLLPDYMVPASFVFLDLLPLNSNGKVERSALPAPDRSLQQDAEYVAPQSSVEQALAQIWQQLLGLENISVHDNFFALGGDSILSIQIVARAQQADIQITPKQLFQHQTIAQLAATVTSAPLVLYNQGEVTGTVDLLPIQQHFFSHQFAQPHHYNQAIVLQIAERWSLLHVQQVADALLLHHDALRLRFTQTESGWQQRLLSVANTGSVEIEYSDLRGVPAHELSGTIETIANRIQASLDIEHGPLLRMAFFECTSGEPARLLFVIHHQAVDGISWRILLEDMQLAFSQLSRGEPIQLPAKTASLQDWAEHLRKVAQEAWMLQEVDYWRTAAQVLTPALPLDLPTGHNTQASARQIRLALTIEETDQLFHKALRPYHSQIQELLLLPLLQVLARWTGGEQIRLDLEGHGREDLGNVTVDVSRTVGWFTSLYPVLFTLPSQLMDIAAWIKSIKEQVRAIPHKGIGYGLLRFMRDQLDSEEIARAIQGQSAQVVFNYLGQFDQLNTTQPGDDALLKVASEPSGMDCGLDNLREYILDVSGQVLDGQLQMIWTYSEQLHRRETIEALADEYMRLLRSLLAHCLSPVAGGWTPSDFSLAHLTQAQLDRVLVKHPLLEDLYPLTPLQQGMLFHTLREPGSGAYIEQIVCTFQDLHLRLFVDAWQQVIAQRSILRTAFEWRDGEEPLQLVERQVDFPMVTWDWRDRSQEQQQRDLEVFMQEDRLRGFDLQQAPVMRQTFIRLSETRTQVVWSHHQILIDGWSMGQLMQDIFACYIALMQERVPQLQPRRPYREYLAWLGERSRSEDEAYWSRYLAGFRSPTPLGVDYGTVGGTRAHSETRYGSEVLAIPLATNARWQAAARQYQVTLNTLVLGAWTLLLSRYSGQQDVLFGAVVSGRPPQLSGMEHMIGLFINTLPVRVQIQEEQSVKNWLVQLQEQQVEHRQYEHCALVQVQGWSEIPRDLPLFESLFVFENYPIEAGLRDQGRFLNLETVEMDSQTNYPLTILVVSEDELRLRVNYDHQRFDQATVQRLLSHLQAILEQLVSQPDLPLADISLLTPQERQQLLMGWNAPNKSHVEGIYTLFEAQAVATPDAVAVVFDEQMLTYAELNRRANQFAHYLQTQDVGPEVRVGVLLERSLWLPIALLGILKAGGAYVPLDPALPLARLGVMAQDSQMALLVTSREQLSAHEELVGIVGNNVLLVEQVGPRLDGEDDDNLDTLLAESNLAYIVYTSGSTGRPKGVLSTHAGVVNYLRFIISSYRLTSDITVLQIPPISFDASVRDIFATLSVGGRLVLVKEHESKDLSLLVSRAQQQRVTALLSVVPSFLRTLLETFDSLQKNCPSIQLVLSSGERLPLEVVSHARSVFAAQVQVVNQYGPTEATMTSTYYHVEQAVGERGFALIGRPIEHMQAYVLDSHQMLVPIGVTGEVYLTGPGLARGYVGQAGVTAERFVPNPFSLLGGARMYRTGDLARYHSDGMLEYIGRRDQQVKVRGNRVELGEIIATLEEYSGVGQAIVIAQAMEPSSDIQILAYILPEQGQIPAARELRTFLQARLPEYMLPSHFIALKTIPLTPNGKLDRRALPLPAQEEPVLITEEILTPLQAQVASIWAEMLHQPHVNLHDDFFTLGGHSLLALQLINRVRTTFEVDLPLDSLFETPTVAEMALIIEEIQNEVLEQTEAMQLARLLDSVEGLSEDEIDSMLSVDE